MSYFENGQCQWVSKECKEVVKVLYFIEICVSGVKEQAWMEVLSRIVLMWLSRKRLMPSGDGQGARVHHTTPYTSPKFLSNLRRPNKVMSVWSRFLIGSICFKMLVKSVLGGIQINPYRNLLDLSSQEFCLRLYHNCLANFGLKYTIWV